MGFKKSSWVGGSLQGYVDGNVPFATMVEIFGEPLGPGDKTLAEWNIQFDDGTLASIYDWKNYGLKREDVTYWHIGGNTERAVDRVNREIAFHLGSHKRVLVF